MSGDVQPRKRKDKKRKKELSLEEPRGTAAALGEGDVFLHSQHEHGTGGHWCAKIIFFALLAVLVGLIGLIILENRGLSELEANSVESRYSGVLEGWLEDAHDHDHHDEHTLELKHHDDDDDEEMEGQETGDLEDHEDDYEIDDEAENEVDLYQEDEDEDQLSDEEDHEENYDDEEKDEDDNESLENNEEDDGDENFDKNEEDDDDDDQNDINENSAENNEDEINNDYYQNGNKIEEKYEEDYQDDEDNQDDDQQNNNDHDEESNYNKDNSVENTQNNDQYNTENKFDDDDGYQSQENNDNYQEDDDHEEDDDEEDVTEVKLEHIEREVSDDEPVSLEAPSSLDDDRYDNDDNHEDDQVVSNEVDEQEDEDDEFLDNDEIDNEPPVVERITAPPGKPFKEVEDEDSTEHPPIDTLAEEDEYLKRQEELRQEEDKASHQDGGDSFDDEWPGEPHDYYWRQQIDTAENELREGAARAAAERMVADALGDSARARWVRARALDLLAEQTRDNAALERAIAAYLQLLRGHERLADRTLRDAAMRTIDRIRFRGSYMRAEPVHKLLIRRFPRDPELRNALSITYLMANEVELAEKVLKDTLEIWPDNSVSLAHYAFVLKTQRNRLEEAAELFSRALRNETGPAGEPRFYYHWGDALLLLGRTDDAARVHRRAAELGHFLSPHQRSLYNVDRLEARPWWDVARTPYARLARDLEAHWEEIRAEGEAAHALYEQEREGLRQSGEWTQLDLFVRGRELPACARAPRTCAVVRAEPAAAGCRRGQVKFSLLAPGTRVRPHVGPTNCRLRMHLALSNTEGAFLRVHNETRQWRVGSVWMFDDSFEHEAWHEGARARLVLIVDVWHPQLTPLERRTLPAI